jgi:antitoxin (DNA-binding transcriptional repressor) of toxin-antitoxin stability system
LQIVNIRDAKTHLSRPIEKAARGEAFIIAKAGKPLVKVMALDLPARRQGRRLGFLAGQVSVPDDFDQMGSTDLVMSAAKTWRRLIGESQLPKVIDGVRSQHGAEITMVSSHNVA